MQRTPGCPLLRTTTCGISDVIRSNQLLWSKVLLRTAYRLLLLRTIRRNREHRFRVFTPSRTKKASVFSILTRFDSFCCTFARSLLCHEERMETNTCLYLLFTLWSEQKIDVTVIIYVSLLFCPRSSGPRPLIIKEDANKKIEMKKKKRNLVVELLVDEGKIIEWTTGR